MELKYTLEEADLVAFQLYHAAHSPLHQAQRRKTRWRVPFVYVLCAAVLLAFKMVLPAALFAGFAALWVFAFPAWATRRYRAYYERHVHENYADALGGPVVCELQDEGILVESELGRALYRYKALGPVVRDAGRSFVYIGKAASIVLPEAQIPAAELTAFLDEVERRKEAASRAEARGPRFAD